MYGKIFASTYTGFMMAAGENVFSVWGYVVANADAKGYVELNPRHLASLIGSTPERMQAAIEKLCQPDPDSRSPENEGKRLTRDGQFLYHITNYAKYRAIFNAEERKAKDRTRKADKREAERDDKRDAS